MSIQGVFFQEQILTPQGLGAFGASALTDGILQGCAVSVSGSSVTVGAGHILIGGRVVQITAAETLTADRAMGFARVLASIDLTAAATEETFAQVTLGLDYAAAPGDFAALTQEDINGGGGTSYTGWIALADLSAGEAERRISTGGGPVKLWENPSSSASAAFAAQVVTIPAAAAFDGFVVTCRKSTSIDNHTAHICIPADAETEESFDLSAVMIMSDMSVNVYQRNVRITGASGQFEFRVSWRRNIGGSQDTGSGNNMIPLAIYGFKAGVSGWSG